MLVGLAAKNAILIVEFARQAEHEGKELIEAVVEAARLRLRPILMTALMAGLGLLPAALSHGIGSETQRPFAVVIVGGIVSATIFTLLLLPLSYTIFKDKNKEE